MNWRIFKIGSLYQNINSKVILLLLDIIVDKNKDVIFKGLFLYNDSKKWQIYIREVTAAHKSVPVGKSQGIYFQDFPSNWVML